MITSEKVLRKMTEIQGKGGPTIGHWHQLRRWLLQPEQCLEYFQACKVCGKPVDENGHFDIADIDGAQTITSAYCAEHWKKLGEPIPLCACDIPVLGGGSQCLNCHGIVP